MKRKNVELLSPAGNIESFKAAIGAGTDAVYMGINKFNARNMAQNFSTEEYIECIEYAHKRNVKVYLTLNILLKQEEVKEALELLIKLYSKGLDAVILQDLGFATLVKKVLPHFPMHASTQMSVYNLEGVKHLQDLGFERVVLARELTNEEIEYICKNTDIEIEVFVHGALCVCMSGACQMSSLIGDRSANRGTCAQPCRQSYTLTKNGREVVSNKYILSKKDIYGIDSVETLIKAGITSLKIEGRNRTPEYVAGVTKEYRKCLDGDKVEMQDEKDILQLFNRSGKSTGYLKSILGKESIAYNTPKNTGLVLGQVIEYSKPYVKVKLKEKINMHDGIEIYSDASTIGTIVTNIKNISKNSVNKEADIGDIVLLGDIKQKVNKGDIIYKTSNNKLNMEIYTHYVKNEYVKKVTFNISVTLTKEKLEAICSINGKKITETSEYIPQKSIKSSVTKEDIIEVFSKTENTPYILNIQNIELEGGLFVPKSVLNELRRKVTSKIDSTFEINIDISEEKKNLNKYIKEYEKKNEKVKYNKVNSFYTYNYNSLKDYISYYKEKYGNKLDRIYIDLEYIYNNLKEIQKYIESNVEVYANISNFSFEEMDEIKKKLEKVIKGGAKGIVISNVSQIDMAKNLKKEYEIRVVSGYELNVTNIFTAEYLKQNGVDEIILGVDIAEEDIQSIQKILEVNIVEGVITAITSRYCIIRSFGIDTKECNNECKKGDYCITDKFNKKYNIVCDNKNHVMRLVRNNSKKYTNINNVHVIKTEV